MSINSYLEETASNLIIKGNEKESIDVSLNTFKDRKRDYFSKYESVDLKEIKVFGSYQRDTNLPQSVDYGTDVDIMLVMDNDGATPQTYLDRVRKQNIQLHRFDNHHQRLCFRCCISNLKLRQRLWMVDCIK